MKPIQILISALLLTSLTPLNADDKPAPAQWKEDFSDETVFKQNWQKYDALLPPYQDKTRRFWQITDGVLRGGAFLGIHPVGITRKITGTDVRLKCRIKLGAGAGFYANFSGMGGGANTVDPQSGIHFRGAGLHLHTAGISVFDGHYIQPPAGVPYVKGMDLAKGNMNSQKISLTENEWHDLVMEMRGKELTVKIDGKQVISHQTHSGDEPKMGTSISVGNDSKNETSEAWIDDVSFEPLEKK